MNYLKRSGNKYFVSWKVELSTYILGAIFILLLLYSYFVYILPVQIGSDLTGAFDAYSYANALQYTDDYVLDTQRFLFLYPQKIVAYINPHLIAIIIHGLAILPSYIWLKRHGEEKILRILLFASAFPESLLFLSSVNKEGIGICVLWSSIVAICAYRNKRFDFFLYFALSIILAEISRPMYGIAVGCILFAAIIPQIRSGLRHALLMLMMIGACLLFWAITFGPLNPILSEKFNAARAFVEWYNYIMPSPGSGIKAHILNLLYDKIISSEFSPSLILLAIIFIIFKALVYAFAIPTTFPYGASLASQTWTITLMISMTLTTLLLISAWISGRKQKVVGDVRYESIKLFSILFMLLIACSTIVFHFRYRVPAELSLIVWLLYKKSDSMRLKLFNKILVLSFATPISGFLIAMAHL